MPSASSLPLTVPRELDWEPGARTRSGVWLGWGAVHLSLSGPPGPLPTRVCSPLSALLPSCTASELSSALSAVGAGPLVTSPGLLGPAWETAATAPVLPSSAGSSGLTRASPAVSAGGPVPRGTSGFCGWTQAVVLHTQSGGWPSPASFGVGLRLPFLLLFVVQRHPHPGVCLS